MRRSTLLALVASCAAALAVGTATGTAGSQAPAAASSATDSDAAARDSLMAAVLRSIAGREAEPAEQVFRDVRALRGVPAGRFVRMMNVGFGRSLGVGCTHCHVVGEYAREDRPQKQVAREMWAMTQTINGELLRRIPNLRGAPPAVNCTTCHRGAVRPALDLPPATP